MSILNKMFMITGGAQGLGKGFALAVLKHGGKVILVDIQKETGEETENEFNKTYPGQSVFYHGNISDKFMMNYIWEDSEKKLNGKISVLVNNAGVYCPSNFIKTMEINLISLMQTTYIALEKMSIKNGGNGGIIINIASSAGLSPEIMLLTHPNPIETIPYCVSKSATVTFTKSLALSNILENDGVKVAAICPNAVDTPLVTGNETLVNMLKSLDVALLSVEKVANDFIQLLEDLHNNSAKSGDILFVGQVANYVNTPKYELPDMSGKN
ncbi:15-hydroxyprostaglandin dehydrogenase [NAD(+)] [Hydra vulgaris]|uniref:15-hydroxyprostaglandin dehydrogenase [NAD(+)] n=1 Tax=Hydra vulgaris TaxID=6087 RepID=UPI00019260F8|nr:15-hydroxyprostaglandin dehydrogenase [NAD(+)] [Hydra vulgaris]